MPGTGHPEEGSRALVNPMDMSGRSVLVTGASSGIGQAVARLMAGLGARVAVSGRDSDRIAATLAALPGEGHHAAPFDLSDLAAIPAWIKALAGVMGPLSAIAHCAAVQETRPIRGFDVDFFTETLRTNLGSALALAQGFRVRGCHAATASLVLVASTTAIKGAAGNVVYAASKGGVLAATRSLALELVRDGIRVNAVLPGLVDTPMADRFRALVPAEHFERVVDLHPLGLGRPEDIAHAVGFLAADTARWITGTTLTVDGGLLA